MKSIQQKRNEANERAAYRSKLSTQQKVNQTYVQASLPEGGECKREMARWERRLTDETNYAKITGKVVIPATKCEARKR